MGEVINIEQEARQPESLPGIFVVKFADSKVPVFKEDRRKDFIKYGDDNLYPEYLTYLFNKSSKHNAILGGKANYIFGKGYANGDTIINRSDESLNDLSKKALLDIEIYGGFRFEVIWSNGGKVSEIYHVDFSCIRKGKDNGFYYKECWKETDREEPKPIPAFDPSNPVGSQIFEYNEYRPGVRFYPLPGYIGCNNYIEVDIEISKFHLSSIRNGMAPSKMIQFFSGEPTDEKKGQIEKRLQQKFSGSENAGKFFLVFNQVNSSTSVKVDDLSASELDKQFDILNKTTQQEIYAGHNVTSPMLFGIKTEGQLGGNTELYTAYAIFQNTYSKPKAVAFDKEINWLFGYSNFPGVYELIPTDPIGVQFDVKDVVNSLPKAFVFEALGIPKEMWELENIGSDNRPTPTIPIAAPSQVSTDPNSPAAMSNDNIKNLTAKQHQQIIRVIRQYSKGQLTDLAAKALLRTGYGLSEADINDLLGIQQPLAMSFEDQEESIIAMFDECGDSKNDFQIIKSKKVSFSSEEDLAKDEAIFIEAAFKTYDVTNTENKILELIKKDPLITAAVIAGVIGETTAFVESKIKSFEAKGYLETTTEKIGEDEIIKHLFPTETVIDTPPPRKGSVNPTQIYVKYSYEVKPGVGPAIIPTSRAFCRKMIGLNRLYSRADIENISQRLGYSVFDRKGGWWTMPNGDHSPECRHSFFSHVVIKKGGQDVA